MLLLIQLEPDWDLINKWSQILTIIGFVITIISFIIIIVVKSQVKELRLSYAFDHRINTHIRRLKEITRNLNTYFDDYDTSRNLIKTELGICQSELENIAIKLDRSQRKKVDKLISFIKLHKEKNFSLEGANLSGTWRRSIIFRWTRFYETSDNDIWTIFNSIHEIITQLENIKKDKSTILN